MLIAARNKEKSRHPLASDFQTGITFQSKEIEEEWPNWSSHRNPHSKTTRKYLRNDEHKSISE